MDRAPLMVKTANLVGPPCPGFAEDSDVLLCRHGDQASFIDHSASSTLAASSVARMPSFKDVRASHPSSMRARVMSRYERSTHDVADEHVVARLAAVAVDPRAPAVDQPCPAEAVQARVEVR
jgi:hypothetical protein